MHALPGHPALAQRKRTTYRRAQCRCIKGIEGNSSCRAICEILERAIDDSVGPTAYPPNKWKGGAATARRPSSHPAAEIQIPEQQFPVAADRQAFIQALSIRDDGLRADAEVGGDPRRR